MNYNPYLIEQVRSIAPEPKAETIPVAGSMVAIPGFVLDQVPPGSPLLKY